MEKKNSKDTIQEKAVELSKLHRFICLEWSTGTGKTLGSLKIVKSMLQNNPSYKGYLVCKESTHKKNWKEDMTKHGMDEVDNSMKTILYASLKNQKDKADFIILDECHALTPKRIEALLNIVKSNTRIIFLSATIPDEKKFLMNRFCGNRIHYYKITLNDAFDLKLLPEPSLIVHRMQLNENIVRGKKWEFVARKPQDKKSTKYVYCSHQTMYKVMKETNKEYGVICYGTEKEHYDALTKQMSYYYDLTQDYSIGEQIRFGCRNKYLNIASNRKKFIAEVKTLKVASLVEEFRDNKDRFICFTGSIKQVQELGSESSVHSKNSPEKNQEIVDCFNNLECNELFAVKMLREGVNLTRIEKGIITQLDSGIGSFFQMLGRCLRYELPEMHLLVIQDTQDMVYFKKSMNNFNEKYITWS